ncbi:MAG: WD40/YVTN/BNR-like repeat-containing protein, partial [Planctomycetota bacterium]
CANATSATPTWTAENTNLGSLDVRCIIALPTASAFLAGTGAGIYSSTDGGLTWGQLQATGLINPSISALAVDPGNGSNLWAATKGGGVYASTDDGANWTQISAGLPDLNITAMTYHVNSETIYAGTTANGVYSWDDVGSTWNATGGGTQLGSLEVLCLGVDLTNENRCYAGTPAGLHFTTDGGVNWAMPGTSGGTDPADGRTVSVFVVPGGGSDSVLAGGYSGGVSRTINATGNMDFLDPTTDVQAALLRAVAADPNTASRYYAGGGYDLTGGTGIGEMNTANDGGLWTNPTTPPGADNIVALAHFDGATAALFAAVKGSGVWASTSATLGDTWALSWAGPTSNDVLAVAVVDASAPGTLLAGCDTTGIWRSTDGGASWVAPTTSVPAGTSVRDFAVEPGSTLNVYAATDVGIYISTNGGDDWIQATTDPSFSVGASTSSAVLSVLVDPGDNTVVYAGTEGGGIFVSTDSGATFAEKNLHIEGSGNVKVYDLTAQPLTPFNVFATTNAGLYRTEDMAVEWHPVHDSTITDPRLQRIVVGRSLALNPGNQNELWVGCAGRGVLTIIFP